MSENQDGKFRHRKVNFSAVSNSALQDSRLSLKAKGLYSLIQSQINKPNYDLYKWALIKQCKEGKKAFDAAWKELKDAGYLKIYRIPGGTNDQFKYEYELLDEADDTIPSLINLNKKREVIPQREHCRRTEIQHTPQKGVYAKDRAEPAEDSHIPQNGVSAEEDKNSHTPHFVPYANGTLCEAHPVPNGGKRRNTELHKTELRNIISVSQSTDGQTDQIREIIREQIEYDYFLENNPFDIPGIDVLVECIVDMLKRPSTKINGVREPRDSLLRSIDKIDSCTIIEFLTHMRSQDLPRIKNITSYWQTSLITFLREQELLKLQA